MVLTRGREGVQNPKNLADVICERPPRARWPPLPQPLSDVADQVSELGSGNVKYSEAVRQLEGLLELERETLSVKRKVAGFSVDYDDDLVITELLC